MDIDRRIAPRYARHGMSIPAPKSHEHDSDADQHLIMFNVPWSRYEAQLALRGEHSVPRVSYLDGAMELMSPSYTHERVNSNIGRLVEAFLRESGIEYQPVGSWTLKSEAMAAGAEPDECYVFGDVAPEPEPERPDLAIEVVRTHGGLNKLEIYRRLGVTEVWFWRKGTITVHVLRGERYEQAPRSQHLPELDLPLLTTFLDRAPVSRAIREYVQALRAKR
jgi:Uma2 family endonuclease